MSTTKETKHTPGPWHANVPTREEYADGSTIREPIRGDIVAVVGDPEEGSIIANARLIASAPDLLEFMDRFANDYAPNAVELARYRTEAKALIAKAEGR